MTVAERIRVRVWVTDVWDIVRLDAAPDWTVVRLKRDALALATGRSLDPDEYVVKYRGGPVLDETVTLLSLQVPNNAPFIVLPRRRRPVR